MTNSQVYKNNNANTFTDITKNFKPKLIESFGICRGFNIYVEVSSSIHSLSTYERTWQMKSIISHSDGKQWLGCKIIVFNAKRMSKTTPRVLYLTGWMIDAFGQTARMSVLLAYQNSEDIKSHRVTV